MCKYCEFSKLESVNIVVTQEVDVSIGGKSVGDPWLLNILMNEGEGGITLESEFYVDGGDAIAACAVEIEYCPFCGRKLH